MLTRRLFFGSTLAMFATGCYGKFALTQKLYGWNGSLGNKFVNTIVLWAFIILPVYEVCAFVDFVALNLIEFWSGTNPLAQLDHEDGSQTRLTRVSLDTVRLERLVDGVVVRSLELQRPTQTSAMALNPGGQVVAQAELLPSGALAGTNTVVGSVEWSSETLQRINASDSMTWSMSNPVSLG